MFNWEFECTKKYPKIDCDAQRRRAAIKNASLFANLPCPSDENFPIDLSNLVEHKDHPEMVLDYTINGKTRCELVENLYRLLMPSTFVPLVFNVPVIDPLTRTPFDEATITNIRHKMIRLFGKVKFWSGSVLATRSVETLLSFIFNQAEVVSFGNDRVAPFFYHLYKHYTLPEDSAIHKYIYKEIQDATERVTTCQFYIFDLACHLARRRMDIAPLYNIYKMGGPPPPFDLFPDFGLSTRLEIPHFVVEAFLEASEEDIKKFIEQSPYCRKYINPVMSSNAELPVWLGAAVTSPRIRCKIVNEFITFFGLPKSLLSSMKALADKCGAYPLGLIYQYFDDVPTTRSFTSFYPYVEVLPSVPIDLERPLPPLPQFNLFPWLFDQPDANALVKKINTYARELIKTLKSWRIIDDGLIFLLTWETRAKLFCSMANIPSPGTGATLGEFLAKINNNNLAIFMDLFTACTFGQTTQVFIADPLYIPGWESREPGDIDITTWRTKKYVSDNLRRASEQTLGEFLGQERATLTQVAAKVAGDKNHMRKRLNHFFKTTHELARHLQSLEAKFHKQAHHILFSPNLTYDQKLATTTIVPMTTLAANNFIFSYDNSPATTPLAHYNKYKNGTLEEWHVAKSLALFKIMCEFEL